MNNTVKNACNWARIISATSPPNSKRSSAFSTPCLRRPRGRHPHAAIDPASTAFLLQQVQEVLLRSETAQRQAAEFPVAIFNALPAHVALIDPGGRVLAVNEAWRRFAAANGLPHAGAGLGSNYLETTDRAARDGSVEARAAAQGIRQVLAGELKEFTLEYPCHSPAEQRWFQ